MIGFSLFVVYGVMILILAILRSGGLMCSKHDVQGSKQCKLYVLILNAEQISSSSQSSCNLLCMALSNTLVVTC